VRNSQLENCHCLLFSLVKAATTGKLGFLCIESRVIGARHSTKSAGGKYSNWFIAEIRPYCCLCRRSCWSTTEKWNSMVEKNDEGMVRYRRCQGCRLTWFVSWTKGLMSSFPRIISAPSMILAREASPFPVISKQAHLSCHLLHATEETQVPFWAQSMRKMVIYLT
jgi:hypothetical protein